MNLFQLKDFTMHSGQRGDWKIECDSLTKKDWITIAHLIGNKFPFFRVVGVPNGGNKLEEALKPFENECVQNILIVDDVLTTGRSMEEMRCIQQSLFPNFPIIGVVLFARGPCPDWIHPVFQMML